MVSTSSDAIRHWDQLRITAPLGGRTSPRQVRFALLLIVLGFIALASVVAYETPSWQSSDEPEHVRNIETLVGGHWYGMDLDCRPPPSTANLQSCNGDEAQQAPLYYVLMAGWQELAGLPSEPPPRAIPDADFLDWLRPPGRRHRGDGLPRGQVGRPGRLDAAHRFGTSRHVSWVRLRHGVRDE